jgi:methylated-DNA-[protein]-cysteine S-methyltransferase
MTGELEQRLRAAAGAGGTAAGGAPPDIAAVLERSGQADVTYAIEDSPVGQLLLAATDTGLIRLHYLRRDHDLERALDDIAGRLTPRIIASGRRFERARRELDEFFAGRRREFEIPLDWSLVKPGFTRSVLENTARIPFGQTVSYKQIAGQAGNERASRAAGTALGSNPLPIVVPCHRVLHSGGGLGGYTGGLEIKRELLMIEGALERPV